MVKIARISFVEFNNYGCILQNYALEKVLTKFGEVHTLFDNDKAHIDWSSALGWTKNFGGSNYADYSERAYLDKSGVREIPVSIRKADKYIIPEQKKIRSFAAALRQMVVKQPLWLRPNGKNLNEMKYLIRKISEETNSNYLMFMLHSSELMPGGSPTFKTKASIEKLYCDLNGLFDYVSKMYQGATLREYGKINFQQ